MKTSAAPCPDRHNPIVVYSMICTQQVGDLTHDGCHDLQRVAPFYHAAHAFSTWLLHFCHQSFWTFYKGHRDSLPPGHFPLGLRVLDVFLSLCCMNHFCTLVYVVTETATVSFRTLPVGFTLPTISKNSLSTLFCPLILDHGVSFIISVSGPKIPVS